MSEECMKKIFEGEGVKMTYPVNFYTVKECPMCKSKEIEIQQIYDVHKRLDEWKLKCLNCRYELKQDRPF